MNDDVTNNMLEFIRDHLSVASSQEANDKLYTKFIHVHKNEMENKLEKINMNKCQNIKEKSHLSGMMI